MNATPLPEPVRTARLEAIALVRAVLHGDQEAYETMQPQDLAGLEGSYYALLGFTRGILANIDEPDKLLDALTAATLAHPSSNDGNG